jgi:DNA-directed RNA polymerase specialized sigma24 family protein
MHLRRKKPTEILATDLELQSSGSEGPREYSPSDTSMLGAGERLNLMCAIRKLPRGYEQHTEIAGLLGFSIGCSKSQLRKARKRLRGLLQGEQRRAEAVVPRRAEIRRAPK